VIITSLRTAAFRNLADTVVPTSAKNIFLVGQNGQGKSNFLEALYFCSFASSFRGARDSDMANDEQKDFSAAITVADMQLYNEVLIKYEKGKKSVWIDGKKAIDRKDLLSVAPCVVFCHEDMEFVAGSPERRRWFFDQVLSLYDPVYLDDLRRFRWTLKSRNSVLRGLNGDPQALLDTLDRQYVIYGLRLMEKRETAARLFSEIFSSLYENVSGIAGMTVQYAPSWKSSGEEDAVSFLLKRRAADMAAGLSLSGPHRDRYTFVRGGDPGGADFAANASTGQRRLLALLLRVAQARRYSEMTGRNTILLLDDVLLEMDGEKRRRFLSVLPGYDQAFYTFLPEEPYRHYRDGFGDADTLMYHITNGHIAAEGQ
jgi:DNA replication and repair protein RecF